jgi:hypothetical protein
MSRSFTSEIVEVCDIIQGQGVELFADYGTLLGAVRHKGFIPWDKDADFSFLCHDIKDATKALGSAFKALRSCGYRVGDSQQKMRPQKPSQAALTRFVVMGHHHPIDFFSWHQEGATWRRKKYLWEDQRWGKGREIQDGWIRPIIQIPFEGMAIPAPSNYEALLEHRYGDWKVPVNYYGKAQ